MDLLVYVNVWKLENCIKSLPPFFFNRLSVSKPETTCLSLPPQQCVCTEPSFYVGAWAPNSGTHAALVYLSRPPSLLKVWLLTSGRHHISVLFLTGWLLPAKLFAGSFIRPTLHMCAHCYDQNRSPALLLYLFSPSDLIQVSYINTPIHIFYSDLASDVRYEPPVKSPSSMSQLHFTLSLTNPSFSPALVLLLCYSFY